MCIRDRGRDIIKGAWFAVCLVKLWGMKHAVCDGVGGIGGRGDDNPGKAGSEEVSECGSGSVVRSSAVSAASHNLCCIFGEEIPPIDNLSYR